MRQLASQWHRDCQSEGYALVLSAGGGAVVPGVCDGCLQPSRRVSGLASPEKFLRLQVRSDSLHALNTTKK